MISLFTLLFALLIALSTCDFGIGLPGITSGPGSGGADEAVEGTVSYRERIALTPGATLIVELRDVSLADAPSVLIASQTVHNPGQVPIEFRVQYNEADIDPRNRYSIRATIYEGDGRMAFTNDTAYEVITLGNPSKLDMRLVMVQPPPSGTGEGGENLEWVERPVRVVSANLIAHEAEPWLRVVHLQSTIEGCVRPGSKSLEVAGTDVIAGISLMEPPNTPWAIPCDEQTVEVEEVFQIEAPIDPGRSHTIIVNGQKMATFTLPDSEFGTSVLAESALIDFTIEKAGGIPAGYQLRVVSGRPSGSCTRVNGYAITRRDANTIDVAITHHQRIDPNVACTKDFPITETVVPLGADFAKGEKYTIIVNGEARNFTP